VAIGRVIESLLLTSWPFLPALRLRAFSQWALVLGRRAVQLTPAIVAINATTHSSDQS
jgi:hypothetical protein